MSNILLKSASSVVRSLRDALGPSMYSALTYEHKHNGVDGINTGLKRKHNNTVIIHLYSLITLQVGIWSKYFVLQSTQALLKCH